MKLWNPQYKSLDHWRGIAALWVMLFHGFGSTYDKALHPLVEILKSISSQGWLGVHLFFVISGYCIAANVYKLTAKKEGIWNFLQNRFWRLVPVYWAAFLLTLVLNVVASPFNQTELSDNFPSSWQSWIGNLLLIQPYLDVPYYVVVYWSLVVEIGFYLIVATLLLIRTQFNSKLALFVGLSLGSIAVFIPYHPKLGLLNYWAEFLCGALLFGALLAKAHARSYQQYSALCLIIIFGVLSGWLNYNNYNQNQLWFSSLFALTLYLIYFVDQKIASLRAIGWLQLVSLMSYSLYLLHVPLQGRVINLGLTFIPTNGLLVLPLQVLGWAVALGGSYLFYRCVEKPLNNWRRSQRLLIHSTHENSADSRS
ncbi:MAG: acyltransferase [Chlorogloeopsis fritschii C42_A2020_084]|uniref:acyltransferase family protein n=1 Tax=Chlorogloeopsis fritschii TaxID=1124 RepID=UPI0019E4D78F|nr:acyltransferase [Chlorogloeopsis fritschii]MBF2009160.1 acyltransferase [Chlorogloeopsis fritschii C42_A2020_084]